MEHLHSYKDSFYYHLEGYEEDSSPHCEREAAANVGGSVYEGALSLDDSENQQGNVNQGGHMSPYNSLGPEGDHSNQVPVEEDPEEPDILLPEVPRRQPRRHQIQFHFTEWQVQEMETIFQETQYPDVLTREELARALNVPEVDVKDSKDCSSASAEADFLIDPIQDLKAEMVFQAGEEREEKGARGQPGKGAVGTDSEREEGHFGPAAPGPVDDGTKHCGPSVVT
ncbi:hypothetical protein STEG23_004267 [Scotinomys teguina]